MVGGNIEANAPIPMNELDGIWLAKKPSQISPLIDHYGVLFTGESAKRFGGNAFAPVVGHQTDQGITFEGAENTGAWNLVGKVSTDLEPVAIDRTISSLSDPGYRLLDNNCEHFARYITEGMKTSTQLWLAGGIGALVAIWFINKK